MIAVAVALVAGGCSAATGSTTGPSPSSPAFGSNATGTVDFWARSDTATAATALADLFNATHPKLKVVVSIISDTQAVTKLATAIRGDSVPDLVDLNDIYLPVFTRLDGFENITAAVDRLPYKSKLSPGHLALASVGSTIYGVPLLADLSTLWYNTALFKRAGLNPNDPPKTFAEILSDAKKITALGDGIKGFSFAGDCSGCLGFTALPDVWATGNHLVAGSYANQHANIVGDAPLKDLLTLYQTLWNDKLVPAADRTQSGGTWGADFVDGTVGMIPEGYGGITLKASAAQLKNFAVTPLPGPTGGSATFDGGDDLAIPVGAKNPSGAWEFAKFCLSLTEQQSLPKYGYSPIRSDAVTAAFTKQFPIDAEVVAELDKGYAPITAAYNQIYNQAGGPWLSMVTTAVFSGDIEGALKVGQSSFNQILREQSGS